MDNDIKSRLFDILNAIMEIESFFDALPKEFSVYRQISEQSVQWKEY